MSTDREIQQLVDELPNRTELGFEMFTHLVRTSSKSPTTFSAIAQQRPITDKAISPVKL